MTYKALYDKGKSILADARVAEAELDARLLLEAVCGTTRNDLLVHGDREETPDHEETYLGMIERRSHRVPLQYITGVQDFMGLEFTVNESVLIPRQDTEILVEEVMRELHDGMDILDMCTGSGCILISLLRYSNDCSGVGADISKEALDLAEANAQRLLGPQARAEFVQSDLFEAVRGSYDMIVSNPPYIPCKVIPTLMPEVREHEPLSALDGGPDGLLFYRRIVAECHGFLKPGGMLFFETGCDQAEAVRDIMAAEGFGNIQVVKDYAGLDRVVYGTLRHGV